MGVVSGNVTHDFTLPTGYVLFASSPLDIWVSGEQEAQVNDRSLSVLSDGKIRFTVFIYNPQNRTLILNITFLLRKQVQ